MHQNVGLENWPIVTFVKSILERPSVCALCHAQHPKIISIDYCSAGNLHMSVAK